MTSQPFQFPVLTFSPDTGPDGSPGSLFLDYFVDPDDFSTCEAWKRDFRDGMMMLTVAVVVGRSSMCGFSAA